MMSSRALALALTVVPACVPRPPAVPPPEPMVQVEYGPSVSGGMFLQGFDVAWKHRPHRLSTLTLGVDGHMTPEGELVGVLESDVRGGTWASGAMASDTPRVTLRYGAVLSDDIGFVPGTTELVLNGRLGKRGDRDDIPAERWVQVEVHLPEDAPRDTVAVWLTGLHLDTKPSHPNGYTPHSIAVKLGEPTLDGNTVRFDVYARFEAAPVIDRKQQLSEYGSTVRVDYAVVTADGGHARRFGLKSSIDHGIEPANITRRVEPARLPITVAAEPGMPEAVAGLSGFEVDLLVSGPVAGRYMRSLTVGLEDGRYDPARGTYDATVALRFANSGKLPRPVKVEAEAEFTLLQLAEPADVRLGRWSPPADGPAHLAQYPTMQRVEQGVAATTWRDDTLVADEQP